MAERRGIFKIFSSGKKERNFSVGIKNNIAALPTDVDFGVTVNNQAAIKITSFYAGLRIISENIASLPKQVLKASDSGYEEDHQHAAARVITQRPNEYMDRFSFWFCMLASILGRGEAFARIEFDGSKPKALHFIPAANVKVGLIDGHKMYQVSGLTGGLAFLNGVYEDWEMLHIMYVTFNGLKGIDPITYNAAAIGRGIATQKFSAEYYNKGGHIKAVLETDNNLDDDSYENFMKHYNSYGNFGTPLLEYGIKYKSIGVSPVAAQLIQSETLSIQDVARIFSLPPHLLAEMSPATFSNIEQQNIYFAVYSLRPLCKRIEVQLEAKLFDSSERGKYSVKFDLKGMMRGDDASRSKYYKDAVEGGWMTPNEVRDQEEMQRLDGLDKPRRPLNYVEVGEETNN